MIRVNRPAVPATLATRGPAATIDLCSAYSAAPADYESGSAKFDFDNGIYSADDVKQALRGAQHDKCSFCEAKVPHVCPGDIEHFRPKAAVQETEAGPLVRPGYYWLAYEWTNLLFCCELCNRRAKRNYFPLRYNSRRANNPSDSLTNETAVFINPADENPADHLRFKGATVYPRTKRGDVTWRALELNRTELFERRLDVLEKLRVLLENHRDRAREIKKARAQGRQPRKKAVELARDIQRLLTAWQEDSAEYAAMVRAYLRLRKYQPVPGI
jgi:uncharacterized protein (TIGR02646 family)